MCSRTNKQNSGYNFYNSPSSQCNWVPPRDTKMNIINKTWHQQKSAADRFLCPAELLLLKSQISRESCNLCYSGLLEFRNSYVEGILCYLDFCWQGAKNVYPPIGWFKVKLVTKSLTLLHQKPWGNGFVLVASRLPQLPAVCTQDLDLPTNICQPFPEQQQNCMALHNQKQSLYSFSLFGKYFFPPFFVIGGCRGSSNALWAFVPGYLSK